MKKIIQILAVMLIIAMSAVGCGVPVTENGVSSGNNTDNGNNDTTSDDAEDKTSDQGNTDPGTTDQVDQSAVEFQADVISVENGSLLVASDPESNEYKSSDRMYVNTIDAVITNQEGTLITVEDLKPADVLKITYSGVILESYPAQISASKIEVIDHNVLIDGYLALIDDLYQEDAGLNGDIKMIALDTTGWTDLTEIEKEIIFTGVKDTYGYEVVEGTFEELSEQGLIDKENLYFPEGIHIVISNVKYDEDKNEITCSIKKWRSGTGAIGSDDVTATLEDGTWKITKEGMWIS
ncbi:MAG: DUF3221 domain-containing protein [Mobilitalea sp.]